MRKRKKIKPMNIILHLIFLVVCVICIYPFLLVLFNSITSEAYVLEHGYVVWPQDISLQAFKTLLRMPERMITGTLMSIVSAVIGPIFSILVTSMIGYTLTRDDFVLKKPLECYLMVALFLPAVGLIPTYMVNMEIFHFENNILAYILPNAVGAIMPFYYRAYFRSIPKEIIESATIDGASEIQIWSKMMIPLSKSFIVTQFFLELSGRWKDFTTSLYYMTEPKLQNLEYYVQQVIKDMNMLKNQAAQMGGDVSQFPVETMQFAVVFFSLIPIMIIFPLAQKYFEKGAMVGSIKG